MNKFFSKEIHLWNMNLKIYKMFFRSSFSEVNADCDGGLESVLAS